MNTKDISQKNSEDLYNDTDIAIVGMDLRFPDASNIEEFWNNLNIGRESIRFYTDNELIQDGEDIKNLEQQNYVKTNGSELINKEYFDASFFNFTPLEALLLDPQTRILFECVYGSIENAGYKLNNEINNIGLYAGASPNLYWEILTHLYATKNNIDDFTVMNLARKDSISTWISHKLNLTGPSVSIQTACSTSLVGLDLACRAILDKQCNIAIVGCASISKYRKKGYLYQEGMLFSKDGHCRAFDTSASGMVSGEGVAAIVLRKANEALKEGDNIIAIVKGIGVNNDGNQKAGYHAPSISGQSKVIKLALDNAKLNSEDIGYIETHGTGTILGDAIEVNALKKVFGTKSEKSCAIGAVKSNIGHLDVCAGLAGLVKTALVLKNRTIPPVINFTEANSKLNLNESPFYLNTQIVNLKDNTKPFRAGVSSFGIGGTNVHVVLEEPESKVSTNSSKQCQLIQLSAKDEVALDQKRIDLINYLKNNPNQKLADISYTLMKGRNIYPYKLSFVAESIQESLEILSNPESRNIIHRFNAYLNHNLVFVFTGQGTQYLNMGRDLYLSDDYFREIMDTCFSITRKICGYELKDILFTQEIEVEIAESKLSSQEYIQPILFILEYTLAKLLMYWGLIPNSMIGYSIGEYVAACISEVMTLEDALMLVCKRGKLMQKAPEGVMLSVPLTEKEIQTYLNENISLATINGDSCVVAGSPEDVASFESLMKENRILTFRLPISTPGHSSLMNCILPEFEKSFENIKLRTPKIPFTSNVSGKFITNEQVVSKKYWISQISSTVRFFDCVSTVMDINQPVFIEIGPGQEVSALVKRIASNDKHQPEVINMLRHKNRDISDLKFLFIKVLQLVSSNIELNWDNFFNGENRNKVSLPTYPYNRQKYWLTGNVENLTSNTKSSNLEINSHVESPSIISKSNKIFKENRGTITSKFAEPRNETETKMQRVWCQLFGYETIGVEDNFFELGGDSLKAISLINRIYEVFSKKVIIKEFFRNPSIAQLCTVINNLKEGSFVKICRAEKKKYYLASFAQKRVFFVQTLDENSVAYNMPQFCVMEGKVDLAKIQTIFNILLERHESLRTYFLLQNTTPVQYIKDKLEIDIPIFEADEEDVKLIAKEFIKPFDLSTAPLIRVGIIKVSPEKSILMVDMHHIISDLISYKIIIDEFMGLYNDKKLEVQNLQYKDFTEWQYALAKSGELANQEAFWLNEFKDGSPDMNLPFDFDRPVYLSPEGRLVKFDVGKDILDNMNEVIKLNNSTSFIYILTVYYIFLSKVCNQNDLVIGTPSVGRRHSDFHNIIGKFVNMLCLRSNIDEELTFEELLNIVKLKFIQVMDNQDYQYDELVDKLKLKLAKNKNPIFNVAFSLVNVMSEIDSKLNPSENIDFKAKSVELVDYKMSKFDLVLHASIYEEKIQFMLEYSTNLFKAETIIGFKNCILELLNQIRENNQHKIKDLSLSTSFNEIATNLYDTEEADFEF